jgi:hypothetical protein
MVVVRKKSAVEKGQKLLCDKIEYFFSITHDGVSEADAIVFSANDRGDQENLLAQRSGGVRAWRVPVDNLESTGAYRVMTALAWNFKALGRSHCSPGAGAAGTAPLQAGGAGPAQL